ncbi:hypothetical protein MIND_01302000 [Mycena indigotica]|uniref:HNH nuclease domain-containing protein n=1 Tax=Mycena indigotica TaxID=2126181 RepID=A0A8H6S1I9_9AGAR|nr:uncharacterized protein MIND_01302000 [Mycena indigotica]KAF7290618.1 hypothetical protein MIND_01302000 [Mycena indigotica]
MAAYSPQNYVNRNERNIHIWSSQTGYQGMRYIVGGCHTWPRPPLALALHRELHSAIEGLEHNLEFWWPLTKHDLYKYLEIITRKNPGFKWVLFGPYEFRDPISQLEQLLGDIPALEFTRLVQDIITNAAAGQFQGMTDDIETAAVAGQYLLLMQSESHEKLLHPVKPELIYSSLQSMSRLATAQNASVASGVTLQSPIQSLSQTVSGTLGSGSNTVGDTTKAGRTDPDPDDDIDIDDESGSDDDYSDDSDGGVLPASGKKLKARRKATHRVHCRQRDFRCRISGYAIPNRPWPRGPVYEGFNACHIVAHALDGRLQDIASQKVIDALSTNRGIDTVENGIMMLNFFHSLFDANHFGIDKASNGLKIYTFERRAATIVGAGRSIFPPLTIPQDYQPQPYKPTTRKKHSEVNKVLLRFQFELCVRWHVCGLGRVTPGS